MVIEYAYKYSDMIIFFFNDTATTEIYTLSLHDALPILILKLRPTEVWLDEAEVEDNGTSDAEIAEHIWRLTQADTVKPRSEEHTSELQSRQYLVCRLLLEKKNTHQTTLFATNLGNDGTR